MIETIGAVVVILLTVYGISFATWLLWRND